MKMNNTILKVIIIILLLALIIVTLRCEDLERMLIRCHENYVELSEINDGLIIVNRELIQELETLSNINEEESKNAGNGTE